MATPEENQMEMMLEGGGLNEQGGTVDPISGNEVPDGATQEGVRDDVPAMLSEGEYVMNEASTRYHGVDKLNAMQNEAKQGYNQMEKDGLMGQPTQGEMLDTNSEIPFGMGDINIEDNQGQEIMMADGGLVPKGFSHGGMHDEKGRPIQATSGMRTLNTQNQPNRPQPSFGDSMGGFGGFTFKNYQHPDGRNMMVPFMNGVPMFSIPEGFVPFDVNDPDAVAPTTPVVDPVVTPAEVVKPFDYGGEVDQFGDPESSEAGLDGLANATISSASLATGGRKASSIESFVISSTPYQNKMTNELKKAGIIVPTNQDEKFRQYTMLQLQKQMKSIKTGSPTYNNLADSLANTREYTKDAKGNTVPSDQHPSRKTSIPTTSPYYNKTPTVTTPTVDKPGGSNVSSVSSTNTDSGMGAAISNAGGSSNTSNSGMGNSVSNTGSGSVSANAPTNDFDFGMGGPDGPGDFGGGSGGVSGDMSGPFNKGGLAGKKPKSKKKQYKKGGLATSKK